MSRSKMALAAAIALAGVDIPLIVSEDIRPMGRSYLPGRREHSTDLTNPAVAKAHAKRLRKNQLRLTNQGAVK